VISASRVTPQAAAAARAHPKASASASGRLEMSDGLLRSAWLGTQDNLRRMHAVILAA